MLLPSQASWDRPTHSLRGTVSQEPASASGPLTQSDNCSRTTEPPKPVRVHIAKAREGREA